MDGLLKHVNKSQEMTLTLYIAFLHAVCLWKGGPGVGGDMRRKPCSPPPPPPPRLPIYSQFSFLPWGSQKYVHDICTRDVINIVNLART